MGGQAALLLPAANGAFVAIEEGRDFFPRIEAVIGGLTLATFSTLLFVPVVYSMLRVKAPHTQADPELQR